MPTVALHSLGNSTPAQQQFAEQAVKLLEQVLNTPDFLARVRTSQYSSRRFQTDDNRYVDISNEEIAAAIQSGKEYRQPANNTVDISAALSKLGRKVVGGMTPPNPLITTNTRFFDDWLATADALSLAAHWFHEWLHVAGLRHLSRKPDFQDAVYQIGKLVIAVGRQVLPAPPAGIAPLAVPGQGYLDAYATEEAQAAEAQEEATVAPMREES